MPSPEYATPRKHTRSHSLTTRTRAPEPSITRWTEPSANGSRRKHRREGGPLITGGRGRGSGPALSYRLAFARPGEGGPEERARVVVWECRGGWRREGWKRGYGPAPHWVRICPPSCLKSIGRGSSRPRSTAGLSLRFTDRGH